MKLFLLILITFVCLQSFAQDTCRYTFKFSSDESSLSQTQMKSLDSLILSLEGYSNSSQFIILGHTDNVGDKSYNVRLSEKRCRSVKKFLQKKGVDEKRISFEKYGYDLPVADNETETGRADNRRTSLTIITKVPAPNWDVKPQRFNINSKNETILTTKNGCKIIIPGNAFELPDVNLFPGKIEIEVIEYNNPAYFIASGIPMSYNAAGKLFMFHSEEMLSIKAFKKSISLELKDEVKITLNCRKVDSLYQTGFYKFNLQQEKWFEDDDPLVQSEVQSEKEKSTLVPTQVTAIEPEEKIVSRSEERADDIEQIETTKIDTGGFYLKMPKAKIDTGGYYKKIPKKENLDTNAYACSPNCCDAVYYILLGQKLSRDQINLSCLDFPRKYSKPDVVDHEYLTRVLKDTEARIGSKKYYTIKLEANKRFLRKQALIKIRYDKNNNPELKALRKVKWVYRFNDNSEDYESFKTRRFHDIRICYDAKNKTAAVNLDEKEKSCLIILKAKVPAREMEESIKNYKKVVTPRILSVYCCFSAFDKKYFAGAEKDLSFTSWINYFNGHLTEMHTRYDSLNKNLNKVIADLHCPCGNFRICDPPCIPDSIPWDEDTLVKRLLKPSGPNRMLIIGLGLYNYDQVVPIEDLVTINNPQFMSTTGRKINPKKSFLLLGGINGMIPFEGNKSLNLILNYKNTLFIVDQANRRYRMVLEAKEDMRQHNSIFVLEDITSKTQNLEGLEKELLGK